MKRVAFTTSLPVPYQVELFDALAASGQIEVKVLYEFRRHPSRSWAAATLAHEHKVLQEIDLAAAQSFLNTSDLVVFSGYSSYRMRQLMASRHASGAPWAFWGERPGFLIPQWLGKYYRAIAVPQLRARRVPVWGIGGWAVEGYRRELGEERTYCSVPYFSNLNRYARIDRSRSTTSPQRILFSGSLIKRKGVDLLVRAFVAIAAKFPALELHLLGDGPLRAQLQAMSRPFAGRVHFHGFKQWPELPGYYAQADILCAPSRYDGWGLIIPEGLASGLLVVSTDQTGAALDLVDNDCGWVVPAGALGPLIAALRAAASTSGSERLARIEKGRTIAARQDVTAGVTRVLAAVEQSMERSEQEGISALAVPGLSRSVLPQ